MGRGPTEKYHQQLHPLFEKGSLTCLSERAIKGLIQNESPLILNIEPTNDCNLRCDYCPGEKARAIFGTHTLNPDDLPEILGPSPWLPENLIWTNFHKDGEPLINPGLVRMIKHIKNFYPHSDTHLNTNGLLLTPSRGLALLDAGLDDLTISVDAAWSESYTKRKGLSSASPVLGIMEENVRAFFLNRTSMHSTVARVKMIEFADTTPKEIEDFYKKWHNVADQVQITGAHDWSGGVEEKITDFTKPARHACPLLWYMLAINADKTVSICNVDWNRTGVLGDLNANISLHNIWQGDRLKEIRRLHLYGYFDSPRMPEICKDCVVWAGAANLDAFLKEKTSML